MPPRRGLPSTEASGELLSRSSFAVLHVGWLTELTQVGGPCVVSSVLETGEQQSAAPDAAKRLAGTSGDRTATGERAETFAQSVPQSVRTPCAPPMSSTSAGRAANKPTVTTPASWLSSRSSATGS